jgi:hypothetical protein
MAYTQVKAFRPELAGTTPYLCLANVRKGYGIAAKYSYALLDWQNTQQHRDRNFPAGVAVPVYWNWTGTVGGVRQNYGHCLPNDITEIMTPNGWRKITSIDVNDTVLQFDKHSNKLEWGKVLAKRPTTTEEVICSGDFEATEGHNMYVKTTKSGYKERSWGDASKGISYFPETLGITDVDGTGLSIEQIDLLCAIQADGYLIPSRFSKRKYDGVSFHFVKNRKVDRLLQILDTLGYHYTHRQYGVRHKILVSGNDIIDFSCQWLDNKVFSKKMLAMSRDEALVFADALGFWDGNAESKKGSCIRYSSKDESNVDIAQGILFLAGKRSTKKKAITAVGAAHYNLHYNFLASDGTGRSKIVRKTEVSCVMVEKRFIVVRQHGRVRIVGNCAVHLPDGRIWTDGRYFGSIDLVTTQYLSRGNPSYLGWGESINGVRVVEQIQTPVPPINNDNMIIRDVDNEYNRWALTSMHIRARLVGGDLQRLTRQEFRNSAVGQNWLHALEILEDDGEAKAALEKTRIGAIAVRDNWAKQINDLKAKVTELSAQAAAVAAENVQLKKRIAELEARPTTGGLTTEQATQLSETRSIVQYIKDLLNRIFK